MADRLDTPTIVGDVKVRTCPDCGCNGIPAGAECPQCWHHAPLDIAPDPAPADGDALRRLCRAEAARLDALTRKLAAERTRLDAERNRVAREHAAASARLSALMRFLSADPTAEDVDF